MNYDPDTQGQGDFGNGSMTDSVPQGTQPQTAAPNAGSLLDVDAILARARSEWQAELQQSTEQLRNSMRDSLRDRVANAEATILQRVLARTQNEGRLIDRYEETGVISPEQARMDRLSLRMEVEQEEVAALQRQQQAAQTAQPVPQQPSPDPAQYFHERATQILARSGLTTADLEANLLPQQTPNIDPQAAVTWYAGVVETLQRAKQNRLAQNPQAQQRQLQEPPMLDMGGGMSAGGVNLIANVEDTDQLFAMAKKQSGGGLLG